MAGGIDLAEDYKIGGESQVGHPHGGGLRVVCKKCENKQIHITNGQDAESAAGVKVFQADATRFSRFLNEQVRDEKTADDEEKSDTPIAYRFAVVCQ